MPPRRRQAAPSARAAGASLASLPDGLLERILGLLNQPDRHRAALVSRRWHGAAHNPAVLRSIKCLQHKLPRLQSFAAWLLRHGRHVRSFDLSCYPPSSETEPFLWEALACLGALAAAGSLQQLKLTCYSRTTLGVASWCAAQRQLEELHLANSCNTLRISASLAGLSALAQLTLRGHGVVVDATVQLPPNVERLFLQDTFSAALPPQLSGLTRLSALALHVCCPPDGYAVLTQLCRLARLWLRYSNHLPACLPQLTGLQELMLDESGGAMQLAEAQAAVDAVLQQLTGLTSLCILGEPERCQAPAALARLSRLERCCLSSAACDPDEGEDFEVPAAPLRPGPWAASLRSLGASLDVLAHSTGVLSAAPQLTRLVLTGNSLQSDVEEAFWEWAGSHPSLQQLQIDVGGYDVAAAMLHTIISLARKRPQLEITSAMVGEGGQFHREFAFD